MLQVDSQAKRLLNTSGGSGAADTSIENEEESKFYHQGYIHAKNDVSAKVITAIVADTELQTSNEELPPSSEFMLSAAEITNLKITARLVSVIQMIRIYFKYLQLT